MPFKRSLFISIAAVLILSGCASISPPPAPPATQNVHLQHLAKLANIQAFALKGRLGVITQQQGFSGGIDWNHAQLNDNIAVFSPLGSKIADIIKTPNGVTLTSQDGHSIKANDAESLTEMTMGFRLPLTGLSDWALGRPSKHKIDAQTWDEQGRLTTLKQEGWDMRFENYAENHGIFLPGKIILRNEKVNLKLLVEKWSGL